MPRGALASPALRAMLTPLLPLLSIGSLLAACSPGADTDPKQDSGDTSSEDSADTGGDSDSADTGQEGECADLEHVVGTFDLDPEGPDTQIHASVDFDGRWLWLAWNRPDDTGNFAVWSARMGMDASSRWGPSQVESFRGNRTQPRVAVGTDSIVVAWQHDDQASIYNLSIHTRAYTTGGDPIFDSPRRVDLRPLGKTLEGNAWMPALGANPSGGFTLAASAASADAPGFQALVQGLGRDGTSTGNAEYPAIDVSSSVFDPAVRVAPDGTRRVAWESWGDTWDVLFSASVKPDTWSTPLSAAAGADADAPSLAITRGGSTLLALHRRPSGRDEVVLLVLGPDQEILAEETLGQARGTDHSPAVAWGDRGGLVAWYRLRTGTQNDIVVRRFQLDGDNLSLEPEQVLDLDQPAAPYPLALTATCEGTFFLAWSEGASPAFRLKGLFLDP